MWAEPTFISALCEAGMSSGHPLCTFRRKAKALPLNPILRGWRSYAEGSPARTAVLSGRDHAMEGKALPLQSDPARIVVLRRRHEKLHLFIKEE